MGIRPRRVSFALVLLAGCAHVESGEIWLPRGQPTPVPVQGPLHLSREGLAPHTVQGTRVLDTREVWVRSEDWHCGHPRSAHR